MALIDGRHRESAREGPRPLHRSKGKEAGEAGAGTAVPCPYDSKLGAEGNITDRRQREVRGIEVDAQTRCGHWRSAADIVAIKMACCGVYWACKDCHEELAGHDIAVWGRGEWDERAVLCGACGLEMTIREYMGCESRCPGCGAGFNPGCKNHWRFYFEE